MKIGSKQMQYKTALVTGASSGIGEATGERLATAGYKVYGPDIAAEIVLKAALAARPKLRYTAGGRAGLLRLLRRFAPPGVMDAGIRRELRLDAVAASQSDQGQRVTAS